LKDKENALDIIKKLSKIIKIPFSIKTRTGINDDDKKEQMDFLIKASEYVNMITIHGRTVKQAYTGESDREFIYELKKKANKKCKILGNGGITSYQEIGMKK
jgi:tRNA-dihydrouridine synthase